MTDFTASYSLILETVDPSHWQTGDQEIGRQLKALQDKGVTHLKWKTHPSACDECMLNHGVTVPINTAFPSGAFIVPNHGNCECEIEELMQ